MARIGTSLPAPVYALLTGLNAATVGIIALAAVQLSQKAITDKLTRILVFLGATAGMLYNSLWYFPVLMFASGAATIIWDYRWGHKLVRRFRRIPEAVDRDAEARVESVEMKESTSSSAAVRRNTAGTTPSNQISGADGARQESQVEERILPASLEMRVFSWKFGITVIACFLATFIIVMALRGVLKNPPRGFNLFANLYLAGIDLHLTTASR